VAGKEVLIGAAMAIVARAKTAAGVFAQQHTPVARR
jgi:hypothetical protein